MAMEQTRHIDRDPVDARLVRIYRWASIVAVAGNVVLLIAKAVVARESGSSAIFSDAANSASDVAHSILMTLGLILALKPPRRPTSPRPPAH